MIDWVYLNVLYAKHIKDFTVQC